jgi:hypothetical protein
MLTMMLHLHFASEFESRDEHLNSIIDSKVHHRALID